MFVAVTYISASLFISPIIYIFYSESLNLSRLKYIIIDATWKDVKERSVFDDGCKELMLLFANSLLLEKIRVKKETKIAFY